MASVLESLASWTQERPAWQQDAVRRLLVSGALNETDLRELAELCKKPHGLSREEIAAAPLRPEHLPTGSEAGPTVTLESITHLRNVNALAPDQTVRFGTNLTVVFGANAAGKSGYSRILKNACRARSREDILGNVVADQPAGKPAAVIRYKLGDVQQEARWSDDGTAFPALQAVSVFDSTCASVYIRDRTDVAYRPFGLDLFDKLSDACERVRGLLEKERDALKVAPTLPSLKPDTDAGRAVAAIHSLTNVDELRRLGTLSTGDESRLAEVVGHLEAVRVSDPRKTIDTTKLRAARFDTLTAIIEKMLATADRESLATYLEDLNLSANLDAAASAAEGSLRSQPLPGTGSDAWLQLWRAAQTFSTNHAYAGRPFPVHDAGARCVLCQHELDDAASKRLLAFAEVLASGVRRQLDECRLRLSSHRERFGAFRRGSVEIHSIVPDLEIESPQLAASVVGLRQRLEPLAEALLASQPDREAITRANGAFVSPLEAQSLVGSLRAAAATIRKRAHELESALRPEVKAGLEMERGELEARVKLRDNLAVFEREVDRRRMLAAFEVCLRDAETKGITKKGTELTRELVTNALIAAFAAELHRLRFQHIEVELREAGGTRGALYHRLCLKRAQDANLSKIVSEGEARCLSIAAFFAELSTTSNRSAVVFDDPVSSLDHEWRERVAERLVQEARERQVVVFSHDVVFLLALKTAADQLGVSAQPQYLRRESPGAGVTSDALPWPALKAGERVGKLKQLWQQAEKIRRVDGRDAYGERAIVIYGLLREAWERAVEEVLLNGVIERYRKSVETQKVRALADIAEEDVKVLEQGMTKCSRWLPGHDQAAAENATVPEPDEVEQDIKALEDWMKGIHKRRGR